VISERQVRAQVRALAPQQHPLSHGPAGQLELVGDLADLPVGARAAILILRCDPGVIIGDFTARVAAGARIGRPASWPWSVEHRRSLRAERGDAFVRAPQADVRAGRDACASQRVLPAGQQLLERHAAFR
jgi:hypothetical protein